jgi:ABC-type transporter Mla subunit MlaD
VEVFISIGTPYHLSIPCDSTAELSAQGVLGPTVVEIDTRKATGPPVANNGVLKSFEVEMTDSQAAHAMKVLGLTLVEESRKIPEKEKPPIAK